MGFYRRKCYGYDKDKNGELVINEEQAEVVRLIFHLYLKGKSVGGIINELEDRNIKSPTGKDTWSKRSVETMLSNDWLSYFLSERCELDPAYVAKSSEVYNKGQCRNLFACYQRETAPKFQPCPSVSDQSNPRTQPKARRSKRENRRAYGGLALLVLFFVVDVMRTCSNFAEVKRPEQALKLFIRFALAKGAVKMADRVVREMMGL